MSTIRLSRCRNHPEREASARCPSCGQSYCRECVSEHDGRILCSACLQKAVAPAGGAVPGRFAFSGVLLGLASIAGLWLVFYAVGRLLVAVPAPFHDGSFWLKR